MPCLLSVAVEEVMTDERGLQFALQFFSKQPGF